MSSGITQLVAIGAQDTHITGNPQVTFFQSVFKRHSNFAMFTAEQIIKGNPTPGGMSTVEIERSGDLLSYIYLVSYAPNDAGTLVPVSYDNGWTELIESAELLIGGQVIDKQDTIFTEYIAPDLLSQTYAKSAAGCNHGGGTNESSFYPFKFFFCESWQHVLPLVAMPYSTVEIRINWKSTVPENCRFRFFARYISVDTDERNSIINTKEQDILIFQVQKSLPSGQTTHEINFNHPVKFLASVSIDDTNSLTQDENIVYLEANGTELTQPLNAAPFFTSVPAYYHSEYSYGNKNMMFIVPFCLSTCKIQPTGCLNFSRLSSFKIHSAFPIDDPIYGINYNILRIKNGMCAQLYAN